MTVPWRVMALVTVALVVDAAVGAVWPVAVRAPAVPLTVVAAVAMSRGVEAGAVTGFGTGMALDLLAGEQAVLGVHALSGLLVSVLAVVLRRHLRGAAGAPTVVAAVAVGAGAMVMSLLQGLIGGSPIQVTGGVVGRASVLAAIAAPVVRRLLHRPPIGHYENAP